MFDARAAKALAAGEHITIDEAPGLRLVATASRRTWTYRYRSPVDGRMRQIRLGHWPAMGLPAALAAWERVRAARLAGDDPAVTERVAKRQRAAEAGARYTVAMACAEFLEAYREQVTGKTFAEAQRMLRIDAGPIAGRSVDSITRADAFGLIDGMRARPVQAAKLRQMLGAVWDRALDAGRVPPEVPNWWRLILRGKLPSRGKVVRGKRVRDKRVLSPAELGQLLRWLPNFASDVVPDVLTLYLWTCCRGAEIVGMRRDEIAEEGGVLWWTVPRGRLKMRRSAAVHDLRVPLVGRAEAVVRRRLEQIDGPYLFPSPVPHVPHILQKAVGASVWAHMPTSRTRPDWVRPRLPVTDWAPHDLRRTSRTLLAALGCPSEIAEAILGHVQPGVVGTYNRHRYDAERLEWVRRLSDHLETLSARAPVADH